MLQRTPHTLVYLSAAELGITERERAGLIEVRDDLASGRVKHVPIVTRECEYILDRNAVGFNMSWWMSSATCGTVHCIGGFMKARDVWFGTSEHSDALHPLFYPVGGGAHNNIPVERAVRAIDHFFAGAAAECWPMALQDIPAA